MFLNTPEAAINLMDKRGTIYSDKPQLVGVPSIEWLLSNSHAMIISNLGYGGGIVSSFACVEEHLLTFWVEMWL